MLGNFRVAVAGLVLLQSEVKDAGRLKKVRELGKKLCCMPTLLFVCARRDSRKPLIRYAKLPVSIGIG
jgi:hypothetical protein